MSNWVALTAADGNELDAYVAYPKGEPKAALVVVQEIFGVNPHIQAVTDDWGHEGFLAIAPAMFDRYEKGVSLSYDEAGMQKALSFLPKIDMAKAMQDVNAALGWLRGATERNVGIVGYCFGGTTAWAAACRLDVQAAVGYYGSRIDKLAGETPRCPVMLHFGALDEGITQAARDTIQAAHPDVPIFVYDDAGHAFNRSTDPHTYVADAARLAKSRSVLFFEQHLVF